MPKFAKRFLVVIGVLLGAAIIILLCINLYLQSAGVQQRIRDAAARSLGADIKIRSTTYTPWGGLLLKDISVPDPTNAAMNLVEATGLRIRFALLPLLQQRFVVKQCTLVQPKVIVRQLENGNWLIPLGTAQKPPVVEEPGKPVTPSVKGPTFKAELHRFRLRDGSISFLNAKNRTVLKLEKTELDADLAPDLAATGTFNVGRMDLSGALMPTNLGGPFTWDGKIFDLPQIAGSLAGGKITGHYRVENAADPRFDLALLAESVMLRKLASDAHVEPGKTDGLLQGSLSLAGDPRNTDSITGQGHFELLSARIRPVEFLTKLGELLQIDELQMLKLSDAKIDLSIKDERVNVDNINLKSENLILRGSGPVRFNGKMNIEAQLLVNRKLQKNLKGILGNNFVESEDPEYRQLPFTVTGKIDSPRTDLLDKLIGIKIGSDVPDLLQNLFRSIPSQPKKKNGD